MTDDVIRQITRDAIAGALKGDKGDRAWLSTHSWPKPTEHIAVEEPGEVVLQWPQGQTGNAGEDDDASDGGMADDSPDEVSSANDQGFPHGYAEDHST